MRRWTVPTYLTLVSQRLVFLGFRCNRDDGSRRFDASRSSKYVLSNTKFVGTNFHQAFLAGAEITNAFFGNTIFADTSLTGVHGLDTAKHGSPSTRDIRTLSRSGQLPTEFLDEKNSNGRRRLLKDLKPAIDASLDRPGKL